MVSIGIIGLGTVGGGVAEILERRKDRIRDRVGAELILRKACDLREELSETSGVSPGSFTTDYREVLEDDSITLVAVLTGNADFAFECIKECFKRGKHVVTANKALLASRWREIFTLSRESGCLIYFEASVGSGIPVIQGINEGLAANTIDRVKGILNGTSNYILTRMSIDSSTLSEAEALAVKEGFAEVDSSADISGLDAAHKLCVLANVIFPRPVELDEVYREGIDSIEAIDIEIARDMFSFSVKPLAVLRRHGDKVEARVHPALLPEDDMLAGVSRENNGILVEGDAVKGVMFYGKGAGRYPAASAVVSDIIYLAQKINYGVAGRIPYIHTDTGAGTPVLDMNELSFQYYLRFMTVDEPGVLSEISGILGESGVSILSCFQRGRGEEGVPIIMLTHKAREGALREALSRIDALEAVKKKSVFIRVESDREIE